VKNLKIKPENYDEWQITCQLCEYEWEVYTKKQIKNLVCPRCGYMQCSIIKEDSGVVKKRGKIIGFVEYDPIKEECGAVYDVDEDGNMHKRK
jgi:hypothetical protein